MFLLLAWMAFGAASAPLRGGLAAAAGAGARPDTPRTVVALESAAAVAYPGPARTVEIGAIRRGSVLEVYEEASGPGCAESWLRVGEGAWICGTGREVSRASPRAERWPPPPGRWSPLPFLYVHPLGRERVSYDSPADAVGGAGGEPLDPGTWESVEASFVRGGVALFRTVSGRYLRQGDVRWAEPSWLRGMPLSADDSPWPYGFVIPPRAVVYDGPPASRRDESRATSSRLQGYGIVRVEEEGDGWVRIGDSRYVRRADVRLFRLREPPEGAGADERWLDIDLAEQVLAAYEGSRPRFVSLCSAGKGTLTREGSFHVFRAAGTQTMRGLPVDGGRRSYLVRDVPWVLFFDGDRAIHGAFWHDEFGTARSHGCVNLPPAAARWVFDFASPVLPDGWLSIETADANAGTLVRIHR